MNKIIKKYISIFLFILIIWELPNYISANGVTLYSTKTLKEKKNTINKSLNQKEPKVIIDSTVKLKANSKNQKIIGKGKVGDTVIFKNKNNKNLGKVTVNENGQFEGIISQKLSVGDQIRIYEQNGNEDKNASESVVMNVMQSSISNKQSPVLKVKTDIESLQSMLTNQAITGTGVAGNNITISNGSYIWVGKVDQDGTFNIKTKGLKKGDVAFIIERNNNNESSSLQILFNSTENKLKITKQPKYIIMDLNGQTPTFVDDQGKTPEISGYWSSKFLLNKEVDLCLIHKDLSSLNFPWNSIWYSNHISEDSLFDNKKLINNFQNISLLPLLNSTSGMKPSLKNLSTQSEYKLVMDIGIGTDNYYPNWKWVYASNSIPFYIKAPKVTVNIDSSSMNTALTKQIVSGTGQIGDTVTITNKGQNYTGTVDNNGNYNIIVKNLGKGDKLSITEINGTGDKSISDPVIFDTTQIPTVGVKTDIESLQSMLTNQTIAGVGTIGYTVTIKDGKTTWTGTVGENGTFTINTPGLKKLDTVSIIESDGKKESLPFQITFNSKNELTISKQPKYIIMDPNGKTPTFVDENGKSPEISGYWSSLSNGSLNEFDIEIGLASNIYSWQWFSEIKNPNLLKNNTIANYFNNISLNSALENYSGKSNSYNLKELSVNQKYKLFETINTSSGAWIYSKEKKAIPFYIKAPKVNVNTDSISMNNTLTKQIVSGTGQIGDTVTITNKGQNYTGTVDNNGNYNIIVKNLEKGDKLSITEINGTGDKSISDPVIFDTTQIPGVGVKIDIESLQSMLTNQVITGVGMIGCTVTIKDGEITWTGTVGENGTFTINTPGLKKLDTVSITESDGKKESLPFRITFNSTENKLTITKQPKYIIMDPSGKTPTFVDENGKIPEISGYWSTVSNGNLNGFYIEIGLASNIYSWQWFSEIKNPNLLKNNTIINNFNNISLNSALENYNGNNFNGTPSNNLKDLDINQKYKLFETINTNKTTWIYSKEKKAIPFYIKAPKVTINTDLSSINTALTKQIVSGTGQIGDTVTITNKGQNYTGTVDNNGNYNIMVKNLEKGDKLSITEINGTGDKSISDPVIFDTTQIPNVLVKTDLEDLQSMLTNQTITGMGKIGCTVTIKDGKTTWTGTVGENGTFTINTHGLKRLDTVSIIESDGKKESSSVQITFNSTENKLTITKQPKYIIMDPNGQQPTFVDESGNTPKISGNWSSTSTNDIQALQVGIGSQNVTMSDAWYWCNLQAPDNLKNTSLINKFENISLLSGLEGKEGAGGGRTVDGVTYNSLTKLPVNQTYGVFLGMESQDKYNYATLPQAIPFYIKAPKVKVLNCEENLQLMLENGFITGSGQIGDIITITNKGHTYTGKVNNNGSFNVLVDNLSYGDQLIITQTNGTGDKSISDPVTIKFGEIPSGTERNLNTKENSLGVVFFPKLFDFNIVDLTLNMPIKSTNSNEQYIGISDNRNTSTGWNLTAQATPFKDKNGKIVSIGTITMNKSIEHVSVTQDDNSLKSYTLDSSIPEDMKNQAPIADGEMTTLSLNNTSIPIASANKGKGQGTWAVKFSNIKLDAENLNIFSAGTYEGEIIWNLSDTP